MRKFKQLTWLLSRRSLIVPCPMLAMDLRVIQHRLWQRSTERHMGEGFLVLFEQGINHREHLSCNAANHTPATNIRPSLLVIPAFDGDQALIESSPFTIHADRLPDGQIDGGLEQARATWRETSLVQCRSRLGDGGNPTAIRFKLSWSLKVGDVANESNENGGLKRPNAWNRDQNLALAGMLDDLQHLAFQLLQMLDNEVIFF